MNVDRSVAVIDQGSSSTKGALVTASGTRLDEISLPIRTHSNGTRVQHEPDEIEASVRAILERLLDQRTPGGRPPAAIGLTCQRSTCLLWDRASGQPLTPTLSWQDTSQAERTRSLLSHSDAVSRTTGLRLSPHYAASKLAALIEGLPNGHRRAAAGEIVAGTLDAWLIRQLTGRDSTEPGHAGRTLLYDLERGCWSVDLADIFGVPVAALPPVEPSAARRGSFLGVPVTAVAGDQQAALLGHGGWHEGTTAAHFGTGAFVLAATGPRPVRLDRALSAAIASTSAETRFQIEATVNSAGSAVDWASRLAGVSLDRWSKRSFDTESVPKVFPAFRGAGAPWWQPEARTVVAGLGIETPAEDLLAGVIVGVAMRVLDCVELLHRAVPIDRLRVSGKLTRLEGLVGLLADASGIPVAVAGDEETGLAGIARLALAGLDESEASLLAPLPPATERQPSWSVERAEEVRSRWQSFAEAALDLGSQK